MLVRAIKALLDENSPISTVRLMSITCILCASGLACYGIYMNRDLMGLAALCTAFIGPAFAGKVVQKHIESKNE